MPHMRVQDGRKVSHSTSLLKSAQIPLNDDKQEKAQRLQSRHELHAKQMDQLKAAASPVRKRKSMGDGPITPTRDDASYGGGGVAGSGVTPMKRMPILANFEEWMKMATDNKINAANSWNFALIDYFHDMSLLKEGDGVNFQKASCTLDGCVKIYTSRVDSVATETGKLLSGLASSGNKKQKDNDGGEEDGEDEDDEDGEGNKKKQKKKAARSAEATLANSFDQIKLKKMELEFSVDPLFKKASADFDEGGAKGLLLNHLSIDGTGRIVFDSSDDAQDLDEDESRRDSMEPEGDRTETPKETHDEPEQRDGKVDIAGLAARFFPDLSKLNDQDICPSLKTFELGSGDGSLELPFLKAPENWRDEHPELDQATQQGEATDFHDGGDFGAGDDDDVAGGFDLPPETGFGEGGEAWARDAALEPQLRVYNESAENVVGDEGAEVGTFDVGGNAFGVVLQHRDQDQENVLNYFDDALKGNWAGPQYWKIARVKDANKPAQPKTTRKEKEPFEIDFAAPMTQELANMLYTPATSNSAISLPRNQWKSKSRNLLPDDKHFNSKDLLKLFLKPKAKIGSRRPGQRQFAVPANGEVDEAYWAAHANQALPHPMDDDAPMQGDYDANFFQDDNLPLPGADMDDDEFADAREDFSPGADEVDAAGGPIGPGIDGIINATPDEGAFGAQLVAQSRRARPEYVQYARVAKKVDVRRLKEEMWHGIGFEKLRKSSLSLSAQTLSRLTLNDLVEPVETPSSTSTTSRPRAPALSGGDDTSVLKFTSIMNNLQHVYPRQQMADISTSFGFICLLHLANEKGLVIENVEGFQDLTVRKDFAATELDVH